MTLLGRRQVRNIFACRASVIVWDRISNEQSCRDNGRALGDPLSRIQRGPFALHETSLTGFWPRLGLAARAYAGIFGEIRLCQFVKTAWAALV